MHETAYDNNLKKIKHANNTLAEVREMGADGGQTIIKELRLVDADDLCLRL